MTPLSGPAVRIQVLGPVDLHRLDGDSAGPPLTQPRPLAVLAYLVLARPHRLQSRDTLTALLWPEADQERARHALRNALHAIRKSLGDAVLLGGGDGLVGVAPGIVCDALELEARLGEQRWEAALALYQGELLAGFHVSEAPEFAEWVAQERLRFRELATGAAVRLSERCRVAGDLDGALSAAEHAVRLAPEQQQEQGQRRLMRLFWLRGERAAALRVYSSLERQLRTEFGTQPSRETRELHRMIQRGSAELGVPILPSDADTTGTFPARGAAEPEVVPPLDRADRPSRKRRWQPLLIALALLLAGVAIPAWHLLTRLAPATMTAFLAPVVNATGDPSATRLGEEFSVSVRNQLRQAGWHLVPESRGRQALRQQGSPRAAARATGAALLITCKADSAAGRVRLQLEAVAVETGESLAVAAVLVGPDRLLEAEREVVGSLVKQLRSGLPRDSLVGAPRRGISGAGARRSVLEG